MFLINLVWFIILKLHIYPIEVLKHKISDKPRYGVGGVPYIEKEFSVWRGSQRVKAAIELGYTHIEGVIINE